MADRGKIVDEQTGTAFEIVDERWFDVLAAWVSAGYSLFAIGYLAWVILDTWSGAYRSWPGSLTNNFDKTVSLTIFKLVLYTAVGGGMGAAINNLRSFVSWHAERKAFGWRFIWKYIALPPLGATLAVLVYGIIQGGMAVFNGGNVGTGGAVTSLSAWATGTLAGYGSHKVFIWLDDKVNSFFNISTATVPDVAGKTPADATQAITSAKLKVGQTTQQVTTNAAMVGKVIGQNPAGGTEIACDSKVDLIIGTPSEAPAPPVDGAGKNGQPVKEKPAEAPAGDGQNPNAENAAQPADLAEAEAAAAGVIPPDVNNPPNGEGGQG